MTWPRDYDPILCGCRQHCGDLPEAADDEFATCKGLPRPALKPLVEIVVVPRTFRDSQQTGDPS